MPQACWQAAPDGTYWIDVALAGRVIPLMIDLGMVDASGRGGFSLEPPLYDQIKQAGTFTQFFTDYRLDASGGITSRENGLLSAQLIDPLSHQGIGPIVQLYAARGAVMVPNRVGVVFFHHLVGCRALWNLDQRRWCVEYP
jgi:hypothetical protein